MGDYQPEKEQDKTAVNNGTSGQTDLAIQNILLADIAIVHFCRNYCADRYRFGDPCIKVL